MRYQEYMDIIRTVNDRFRYYKSIESLFELDQWSGLPELGGAYRQQMSAFVGTQKAGLFQTEDAKKAFEYFANVDEGQIEDPIEHGLIRTFKSRYRNAVRVPEETMKQYNLLRADVMSAWKHARERKDYHVFEPWLKQVFDLKKKIALAIDPDAPAFDTMIGAVDEGLKSADVSREFDVLKRGIGEILDKITKADLGVNEEIFLREEDPDEMSAFGRRLAAEAGYDQRKGGFNDKVIHGFTSFLGPQDARVSTQRSGSPHLIFTCLHEAGHAMFSSGGNDQVNAANMWGGIEGSFHEANARFYENIVGRSREYWEFYYPQFQKAFPFFKDIKMNEFYRAMNTVRPSLRRIGADEVTYSLHVILRYELERDYFSGKIGTEDLNIAWNDKYKKYLGVCPENDTEGILQDMHWAGDYIGYFQSYALGNIYDGQIRKALLSEIPDLYEQIRHGEFDRLNKWMKEHIWQYGCCYTSGEMLKRLTGKTLDAVPFLDYMKEKYADLYGIHI